MKIINDDGRRATKRDVGVSKIIAREIKSYELSLEFEDEAGTPLTLVLEPLDTYRLWKVLDQLKDVFFDSSEEESANVGSP